MFNKFKWTNIRLIVILVIYIWIVSSFAYGKIDFNIQLLLMIVLVLMSYYMVIEYRLFGVMFTSFFYIAGAISIGILFKFSEHQYNAVMAFQVTIVISVLYLYNYVRKVEQSKNKLFNQSVIDEVTGSYNRRYFNMKLQKYTKMQNETIRNSLLLY